MNLDNIIIEELEKKLFLKEFLTSNECIEFYEKISSYLANRSKVETFYNNLDETISFLEKLGLDYRSIITSIYNWPAIIHSDKKALLDKVLLIRSIEGKGISNINSIDIIVNHPKDLMTGIDTIYARIQFFLSDASKDVTRKDAITRRKLFKITNSEFENSYFISKDQLISNYPYTEKIENYIRSLEINKDIVDKFNKKDDNIKLS